MNCNKCCKVFCDKRNTGIECNCGVSYLQAGIIDKPKVIKNNTYSITWKEFLEDTSRLTKAIIALGNFGKGDSRYGKQI